MHPHYDYRLCRRKKWHIIAIRTGAIEYGSKNIQKDFSNLGLRMVASAILIFGIQILGQYIILAINPSWFSDMNIVLAATMIPMYALGYPLAFVILQAGAEKRTIEKHKMKTVQFIMAFLMSYALMMLGNIVGVGVTNGIGFLKGEPVDNGLTDIVSNGNIWLTSIYTVLLAPVFEEYMFRKIICDRLVKYGQGMAIIMSGFMFGLFHGNFNQFLCCSNRFFLRLYLREDRRNQVYDWTAHDGEFYWKCGWRTVAAEC